MTAVRTHRDVVHGLTIAEKKALTALSDMAGLRQLLFHVVLLAGLVWWNAVATGGWQFAAMLGQGIAMVFLFTAMHECSHNTAFRTRWINQWVGTAIGFVLFLQPRWFFYFHQAHHKFTQDPERDPELASPKPTTKRAYFWQLSGLSIWRDHLAALLGTALGRRQDSFIPALAQNAVRREAWMFVGVYCIILPVLAMNGHLLQFWLLPLLLGQPFLRLYLLAEHADCTETDNMLVNTRTVVTTRLVRLLAWNMPYHTEHHSFTAVPFHRLPDLHRHLARDLQVVAPGYASFHRGFYRTLSGRFWDLLSPARTAGPHSKSDRKDG